ncbi:hypothetical protein JCM14469_15280 [Desulfatiferula olefinivorans]
MKALYAKHAGSGTKTETHTSSLYELIEAVNASVEPGEEEMVPLIVSHILSSWNATVRER